jgi:hypothetical protein
MYWQRQYDTVVSWYPEKATEYRKNRLECLRLTQHLDPAARRLAPCTVVDDADVEHRKPELERQFEEAKALARVRRKAEGTGCVTIVHGGLPTLGKHH